MKKRSIVYISWLVSLIVTFSCTGEIDISPESTIGVNSFWKTEEDAQGGLYGMYNQFRNLAQEDLYYYGAGRSELMSFGLQNADFRIKYFENTLDANNADLDWQLTYRIVNYANLVIKNVPAIEFADESVKNEMLAQAYAMRANIYFIMAKTWGDVPLMTDPVEKFDAETTFKERTPLVEIFDFIKSDIEEGLALFPDNDFPVGRSIWSQPALNMLKGDVYLWTGKRMGGGTADITTALAALEEAEGGEVALLENYRDIFSYENKGNQEVIFAVHFEDLEVGNNYFQDMYINANDISPNIINEIREEIGAVGGFNWWTASALVRNQFTEDDQRRDATFLEIYTTDTTANNTPSYLTSIVVKARGFPEAGTRKFLDDVIICRYADLLLMKAEAKNALGQDPSTEINRVRQRAYGDAFADHEFVSGSKEQNDEAILQERLFELAFEGKRWWDLVRFDKAFEKVPSLQGRESEQYLLLFPVPESTLSLNSKVKQTQGY